MSREARLNAQAGRWVGASVPRKEDRRMLLGRGRFVGDLTRAGMLHAAFARSPFPAAEVTGIDTSAALATPGVTAAFTADSSRRMPSAKWRTSGQALTSARDNHSVNVPVACLRINAAKSSARSRAAVRSGLAPRILSRRLWASTVRFSGRRTQSKESCFGEGGVAGFGFAAFTRGRALPARPRRLVT